jgi:hypothetical protein
MNNINFEDVVFSNHFLNDRQHRGIGEDVIRELLIWGKFYFDKHNARVYYFTDKSFHNMKSNGVTIQEVEKLKKKKAVRLVVSNDKVVITAMFANKKRKRIYH